MTEEMEIKVLDLIYDKAMEAIGQGWIEDTINLSVFSGWLPKGKSKVSSLFSGGEAPR